MLDPFRVQLLTLTFDSQAVLALIGVAVAGYVFRLAARRARFDLGASDWWDLAVAAVIGGRVVWVAMHLDYYLRGPLQVLVIIDGGLDPVGLVLGAAYAVRGLRRRTPGAGWQTLIAPVALAVLTFVLVERAGCALTTCGGGAPTDLPWALRRGDEWRQPLALYQAVIIAGALLLAVEWRGLAGRAFALALVALSLVELMGLLVGRGSPTGLLALGVASVLYLAAVRRNSGPASVPVAR